QDAEVARQVAPDADGSEIQLRGRDLDRPVLQAQVMLAAPGDAQLPGFAVGLPDEFTGRDLVTLAGARQRPQALLVAVVQPRRRIGRGDDLLAHRLLEQARSQRDGVDEDVALAHRDRPRMKRDANAELDLLYD